MSDPLSDPRAADLLSADPGEVWALAASFRQVAGEAESTATGLRGAQHDATWTGAAADAFRANLGQLPGDLDRIRGSYAAVAGALASYEAELSSVKPAFQRLVLQLGMAQASLTGAQGQLATAQGNLSQAIDAPHAKPSSPAVQSAHTSYLGAVGAVGRLQGDVSGLESQGFALLDRFQHARDGCQGRVSGACGVAPHQSWWDSVLGDVGNWMSDVGHWAVDAGQVLVKIGVGVVDAAKSLPSDLVNIYEHPTDLHDWAKLAEDVGAVAGAVALVAAVIICPADALGLDAAVEVFEATDDVASGVAVVAGADKTAFDAGSAAEGEGSWGTVAFDAVGVASSEVHIPGLQDAKDAESLLQTKSEALEEFGLSRALGATPKEAYADLSDDQRLVLTKSLAKLSDGGRLEYMRSTTTEALEAAETNVHHLDAIDEGAHFVFDKTNEAVKTAVVGGS